MDLKRNPSIPDNHGYVEGDSFDTQVVLDDCIEEDGRLYVWLDDNVFEDRFKYYIEVIKPVGDNEELNVYEDEISEINGDSLEDNLFVLKIKLATDGGELDDSVNIVEDISSEINTLDSYNVTYFGEGSETFISDKRRLKFCELPNSVRNTTGWNNWENIPEPWRSYDLIFQEKETEGEGKIFELKKTLDNQIGFIEEGDMVKLNESVDPPSGSSEEKGIVENIDYEREKFEVYFTDIDNTEEYDFDEVKHIRLTKDSIYNWQDKNKFTSRWDGDYNVQWVFLSGRIDDAVEVGPVFGDDDINRKLFKEMGDRIGR